MRKLLAFYENAMFKQLLSYLVVGGIATVVEWIFLFVFSEWFQINYLAATAAAFAISTAANWIAGRLLTFRGVQKQSLLGELLKIYAVSIIGLLFNLALMYVFVELAGFKGMPSKMLATVIVFAWNFMIRKMWIYKEKCA